MPGDGGEVAIATRLHARNRWILVPLRVGDLGVNMVLDTGAPLTAISERTQALLHGAGLIESAGQGRFVLRDITIAGHPMPDLPVRVSRRVTEAGAEGVLGLDFLRRFTDIHFHVPSLVLTLTDP